MIADASLVQSLSGSSVFENQKKRPEATPIAVYAKYQPKVEQFTDCYFLLTDVPELNLIESCTAISHSELSGSMPKHFSILGLANEMFAGTKPMVGKELEVLYSALSKTNNSML